MNDEKLREFLLLEVRPLILEHYKPNSCVATTKVALEVMRYFGVQCRPMACELMVMNQAYAEMVTGDIHDPAWVKMWQERGAHAVHTEAGNAVPGDGMWDGHLVALAHLSGEPWLLDLSLDQARRTTWGINVYPVCAQLTEYPPTEAVFVGVEDALVWWKPTNDTVWRTHADWKKDDITAPLAGTLIRQARDFLAA